MGHTEFRSISPAGTLRDIIKRMNEQSKTNEPTQDNQSSDQPSNQSTPDGRGERPDDPNQLARWIVEESTGDESHPR